MKSTHKNYFEIYLMDSFPGIVQEYKFHPIRKWRFDWALIDKKIAFEYDGGVFIRGRHSRGAGTIKDNEKINTALLLGWKVFKVCTGQDFITLIDEVRRINA